MSENIKKAIIVFLLLAIAGLGYFSYTNNNKHLVVEKNMKAEKDKILKDLSDLETVYDDAISKNTSLSTELEKQKESIQNFKDSLKAVKRTNWKLIKFYKNKIKNLNVVSNRLVHLNDSLVRSNQLLNQENQDLAIQKDSLTSNLQEQTNYSNTLANQNLELAKKVAVGKVVKMSNFNVITYKERSHGKYKETDRARRVDIFKTSFVLNENPIADEKDMVAYVVITKPDGKILVNKGVFTTASGERTHFSEKSTIPYKKAAITSDIFIKFGDVKLEKGKYIIAFYVNDEKVGTVEKELR